MIWQVQEETDATQDIQTFLLDSVRELIAPHRLEEWPVLAEAARSVEQYCCTEADEELTPALLQLLYSRALWGAGACDAARTILMHRVEPQQMRCTGMRLLEAGVMDPAIWALTTRRIIRFVDDWVSGKGGGMWRIDFTRIADWAQHTDLDRLLVCRKLLTALAPVWASGDGTGALGVKSYRAGEQEIIDMCAAHMQRIARARAWASVPTVVLLLG
jgi:hypothetical protein